MRSGACPSSPSRARAVCWKVSVDATPCKVVPIILLGVDSGHPTRGCIPRRWGGPFSSVKAPEVSGATGGVQTRFKLKPEPVTMSPKVLALDPRPLTLNPEPWALAPKPQTNCRSGGRWGGPFSSVEAPEVSGAQRRLPLLAGSVRPKV